MKQIAVLILLVSALHGLAYDLKIADAPTTATNTTAAATLPPIDLTRSTQFALCVTANMGTTLSGGTNSPAWLPGLVSCVASNSIDQISWFADPTRSFSFAVTTNAATMIQTNFTGLGGIGFEQFTVTVSNNVNMTWTTATKPGL